jgi:hypothetical protein
MLLVEHGVRVDAATGVNVVCTDGVSMELTASSSKEEPLLFPAIASGNVDTVALLLESGASVNIAKPGGQVRVIPESRVSLRPVTKA